MLGFPILREHILTVIQQRLLYVYGNAAVHCFSVYRRFVSVPSVLRNLLVAVELWDVYRQNMLAVDVLHKNIVSLVQYVGTVAVRSVLFEVGILVHIGVLDADVLSLVLFVKGRNKIIEIAFFFSRVVFQHANYRFLVLLACDKRKAYAENDCDCK